MDSVSNGNQKGETEESNGAKLQGHIPLNISASRRTLLGNENLQRNLQDSSTAHPNKIKFLKFGSASAKFKRLAQDRDEMSRSVASSSSHGLRERMKEIDWAFLMKTSKEWIRDPMNMALFVWIMCVAISDGNRRTFLDSERFTAKWDYKPHEWAHMMVVVILLHVNCFAQYALCGLNLGYKRSERPAIGVGICISFAIAAPAIAGVYTIISPLGRDYSEFDEEAQHQITAGEGKRPEQLRRKSLEKRYSFATRDEGSVETRPQWSGGILDFWDDISLAYLSLF
ncbi:hypothetical protein GH714_014068 [Hevea brasiliensis]|uniref:Uncharacterized protein n=1 Tax=Hevea brasiliensis TaxID=3981 RepID=A0A6A6N1D9_HEVBR|nr:hypothetical protein GH714_014068 [Hevea brasiliensis]